HFAPYVKAAGIFFGSSALENGASQSLYPRPGVWTTFFGPLWVDFGWFSVPVMIVFGFFTSKVAKLARAGAVNWLPLHVYLTIVVFFMPVINFIVSAQGMYIINAFALFGIFAKHHWLIDIRLTRIRV